MRAQRTALIFDVTGQIPAHPIIHPTLRVIAVHRRAFFLDAGTELARMECLPLVHIADFLDPTGAGAGIGTNREVTTVRHHVHVMQGMSELGADWIQATLKRNSLRRALIGFAVLPAQAVLNRSLHQIEIPSIDLQIETAVLALHERLGQTDINTRNRTGHRGKNTVRHEIHRPPASDPAPRAVLEEAMTRLVGANETIGVGG